MNRRGFTLLELIAAIGIGLVALGIGYQIYGGVLRAQDVEDAREAQTNTVHNLMSRIKTDVRQSASASASGRSLVIDTGRIIYTSAQHGVERRQHGGRYTYKGITASFTRASGGVTITLNTQSTAHRRPIRTEVTTFVSPRNR